MEWIKRTGIVEANLCRYNRTKFEQVGMDISELLRNENYHSCSRYSDLCIIK